MVDGPLDRKSPGIRHKAVGRLVPDDAAQADGMRIDPPWSPPMAMSTSCKATSTALPLEEPPALRVRSHGFLPHR